MLSSNGGDTATARRLERFPVFQALGIEVLALTGDWRHARIRLPLDARTRNPGGGMFGGGIAALADPVAALACARRFPGHAVWTRALHLDFRREGRSDLELRFDFDPTLEEAIAADLGVRGRADPRFEFGFHDNADRLCVWVKTTVAIRPAGYRPRHKRSSHE